MKTKYHKPYVLEMRKTLCEETIAKKKKRRDRGILRLDRIREKYPEYFFSITAAKLMERYFTGRSKRFDKILFDMPMGERILINDRKPSELNTAIALNFLCQRGCEDYLTAPTKSN